MSTLTVKVDEVENSNLPDWFIYSFITFPKIKYIFKLLKADFGQETVVNLLLLKSFIFVTWNLYFLKTSENKLVFSAATGISLIFIDHFSVVLKGSTQLKLPCCNFFNFILIVDRRGDRIWGGGGSCNRGPQQTYWNPLAIRSPRCFLFFKKIRLSGLRDRNDLITTLGS